jgi:hypothetical protein
MEPGTEGAPSVQVGRRRSRLVRTAVLALALGAALGLALLASGCGGSSGQGVAQVSTSGGANGSGSSSAPGSGNPQAFSACMRAHGVPNFPDPDSSGRIQIPSTIDDRSPTVRAAYRACRSLAPSESSLTDHGETLGSQEQLLAFARCMRAHGVPTFPDPQLMNGHLRMHTSGQIDPNSPVVKAAIAACQGKLRGESSAGAAKLVQGAAGPPSYKKK